MKSVLVYCGSRTGHSAEYGAAAVQLGHLLAQNNYRLLFGGGKIGLMGAIADAVLESGGSAIGVMPQRLIDREIAHPNCSEFRIVGSMQERKALMEDLADIIVTLPGGYGSMDELFESLTNVQLAYHQKPIFLLNTNGFYNFLLSQLDHMVNEGFIPKENRERLKVAATPEDLLEILRDLETEYSI